MIENNNSLKAFFPEMGRVKKIHFIGIGGSGMSGIAEILVNEGYDVSGSDIKETATVLKLKQKGVNIFIGHQSENIDGVSVVVVSSAINTRNPEIIEAKKNRIPIIRRAEMLAELMRFKHGIAVAGTHGKTTTTAMLTHIYLTAGLDPTSVNGGIVKNINSSAQLGKSRYFIAEADESDASFLHLSPIVSIITNIEEDHMDTYNGDIERLKDVFLDFIHRLPFYGIAVICLDDPINREILKRISRKVITYGFSLSADLCVSNFKQIKNKSTFDVVKYGKDRFTIELNCPGEHNALNAAAAISVALEDNISINKIQKALSTFTGAGRRFDILGNYLVNENIVKVVDDYGHHPSEVGVTINAAKKGWPDRRLVMIFQPHRYSRTRDMFDEFVDVLEKVDVLIVLDVYAAGEEKIIGADSKSLCRSIRNRGKIDPIFVKDKSTLCSVIENKIDNNDIILTQGAGDVSQICTSLINQWRKL